MRHLVLPTLAIIGLVMLARADIAKQTLKPAVVWTGTDSKQAKESFTLCRDQAAWQAVWDRHAGGDGATRNPVCPAIDFASYMLVAVAHGESSQNSGIKVEAVTEEADCVRVRYVPMWYQIGIIDGVSLDRYRTKTYAFIVLPKSGKRVVLEENVQGTIGEPPVWKRKATLDPLQAK